jgi:hypothetical protein
MIFRSIERRRVRIAFGQFLDEKALDRVMSNLSEWDCFNTTLPRWAVPIFRRRPTNEEFAASLADFEKKALSGRYKSKGTSPDFKRDQ